MRKQNLLLTVCRRGRLGNRRSRESTDTSRFVCLTRELRARDRPFDSELSHSRNTLFLDATTELFAGNVVRIRNAIWCVERTEEKG